MFSEAPINPSQQSPSPGESLPTGAERSEGFRFHYTVGSGSSRKAIGTAALAATNPDALDPDDLEALLAADIDPDTIPHPGCAMISFARRDNHLFEGPDWFIDSGGFSVQKKFHHYPTSIDDYIAYLSEYDDQIDKYTLRDWVCDLALLREADRDVRTHQEWSIRDHVYCLEAAEDADLTAEPVAVLQGHDLEEYLWSFDYLEEHGLASPTLGIGSILRPNKTSEVRAIIQELRDAIPSKYALHGFGISKTVLEDAETLRALDSADTTSWHSKAAHARVTDPEWADRVPAWIRTLQAYMDYVDAVDALIADAYADESAGAATEPGHSRVVPLSAFAAGQSSRPDVADPLVECICGNLVDPNRHPYEENTAWCRFCEQLQFDLWNRQFCVDDTVGVDTDGYCPSQEL
jgi:hypothetical protein